MEAASISLAAAADAGLHYVDDTVPGITRLKRGKSSIYKDPAGRVIKDKQTLARIRHLAIPPAYNDVWICTDDQGHIQATGRDDRGRKQYRYHDKWQQVRNATKYDRMIQFGYALPKIRRHVKQDLRQRGLPKHKVVAAIVELMDKAQIRVGNEEYARENKSYGLTTMHNKHVKIQGEAIKFEFKGKSGVHHSVEIDDPRLAKIVKRCQDLPGYELFQYVNEQGERHNINSSDVNGYLKEISQEDFTAKDFRTWHGTVLATDALCKCAPVETLAKLKHNLVEAIDLVSKSLGNTRSVCRKSYVHPQIMEAYLGRSLTSVIENYRQGVIPSKLRRLPIHEAVVIRFLEEVKR